jgi:L-fucose mutarotase
MPLDSYVETPAMLMATTNGDPTPTIWAEYQEIINKNNGETKMGHFERFEFYDEAKKAYAIIATSESALYANIILKKGVIK